MTYPTTPDDARDYYDHVTACHDDLCRTWPHMWSATTEGTQYFAGRREAEQADRERRAYR